MFSLIIDTSASTDATNYVQSPTFIQFMVAMGKAMDAGEPSLHIHDVDGQFATMVEWALVEKIRELTGVAVTISRV
jgi:hypothetical protein